MNENQKDPSNVVSLEPKLQERKDESFNNDVDIALNAVNKAPVPDVEPYEQPSEVEPQSSGSTEEASAESEKLSVLQKLAIGAGTIILGASVANLANGGESPKSYENPSKNDIVTIQPGDTLSGIGADIAKTTEEDETTTEAVEDIVSRTNEMDPERNLNPRSELMQGDVLYVPANGDAEPDKPGYQLKPGDTPK